MTTSEPTAPETSPHAPRDTAPSEPRRLGVLVGDRLCLGCGFNLVGQTIVREPHYSMLIVRCPECGGAAALQEYPLLGRWAGRWAKVLAGLLVMFLIGSAVVSSLVCWGVSMPAVEAMVEPLSRTLGKAHWEWQVSRQQSTAKKLSAAAATAVNAARTNTEVPSAEQGGTDGESVTASADSGEAAAVTPGASSTDPTVLLQQQVQSAVTATIDGNQWWTTYADSGWLATVDLDAFRRSAGGWSSLIHWGGLRWLVVSCPVAMVLGVVWSVLLLGVRRARLVIMVPFVVLGLSMCWVLIESANQPGRWGGSMNEISARMIGTPAYAIVLACMGLAMAAGLLVGRSVARVVVRLMLPPRLCGSLADLWLCDGLAPPHGGLVGRKM